MQKFNLPTIRSNYQEISPFDPLGDIHLNEVYVTGIHKKVERVTKGNPLRAWI